MCWYNIIYYYDMPNKFVEDYFKYRRRNRIIPLQTLLRVRQERLNREATERYVIEIEKYNKVMEELKNNIIVI